MRGALTSRTPDRPQAIVNNSIITHTSFISHLIQGSTSRLQHRAFAVIMIRIGPQVLRPRASAQFHYGSSVCMQQTSSFSSDHKKKGFRPRRRPSPTYRPVRPGSKKRKDWLPMNDSKFVTLGQVENATDELDKRYGHAAASVIRNLRNQSRLRSNDSVEDELRLADYMIAQSGTTEDLVMERRMGMEAESKEEHAKFMEDMREFLLEGEQQLVYPDDVNYMPPKPNKNKPFATVPTAGEGSGEEVDSEDPELVSDNFTPLFTPKFLTGFVIRTSQRLDPNQLAHGEWSEMLITVGRTTKLWRGGRLESYRALVIGGNANGCGGFGIGKSWDPALAVDVAGKSTFSLLGLPSIEPH